MYILYFTLEDFKYVSTVHITYVTRGDIPTSKDLETELATRVNCFMLYMHCPEMFVI